MVSEPRKQSMAWLEHGLQISLKRYALSIEDKMAAGALGTLGIMGKRLPSFPHYPPARYWVMLYYNVGEEAE